jgi:hypothetical protein
MLAYVFWHWPRSGVASNEYETVQRRFHAALEAAPPPGFRGSRSLAITGAPWAAASGAAYEDWYLVEGSAALDPLNEAAVSASRQAPHDAAAALAKDGIAGLYLLRLGAGVEPPGHATWFAKPAGMSYQELYATLRSVVEGGAALWGRQMTLGPTPEFCLHSTSATPLPGRLSGLAIACRSVWP